MVETLIAIIMINIVNITLREANTVVVKPLCTSFTLDHRLGFFAPAVTEGFFVRVFKQHSNTTLLDYEEFI